MSSRILIYLRTYLCRVLIIFGCIATLVSWYFVSPQADKVATELYNWNMNIGTFSLFVGVITVYTRWLKGIWSRDEYWPYQLLGAIIIPVWVIMGVMSGIYSNLYQTAYYSTKITLHVAILGQLMFFMISGAYRTYRIKNFRTLLFAACTITIIACNASWLMTPFPVVDKISYWLLNNPSMAGYRAMMITGAIGGIVLGIRILLGLERGALRATEVS
ncbi:MAG: hypothetical protein DRP27_10350 [Thermotogae bacterium]|nr:MAG: hypothetical protein DRP27_10350 [Thermotogota bacterium]